jgi:hypothetical protein
MLMMCWAVTMVGPWVLLSLSKLAGSVSARLVAIEMCLGCVFLGASDGRGMLGSANCATSSERPGPSKLAGEFLRGRSGNMDDSVDSIRFGERGLVAWSCSSLVSLGFLGMAGRGIDCDCDHDECCVVLVLLKKGLLVIVARPGEAKSKLPSANALLFSDCFLNCSNSGFCSTGIIRGDAAAVERTFEVGGLQLPRMCCAALEDKWSAIPTARPK